MTARSRAAGVVLLLLMGCTPPTPPPVVAVPVIPPVTGIDAGMAYLVRHQSPDGAWRSDEYATFKDGTALTPLVLCSLLDADAEPDARARAAAWLAAKVNPDGTIDEGPDGLPYPVYTAALTVVALSHPYFNKLYTRERDGWLDYLLARQLTEANGWAKGDPHFGGWGYYPGVPRKPKPGTAVHAQHLLESNISATRFALEALVAVSAGDHQFRERVTAAAAFVDTCRHPDGGSHFVAGDPVRNKAGADAGRFHSYGSATADAALCDEFTDRLSGRTRETNTGAKWLADHFDADRHPGTYVPAHESNRNAVYFYSAAATAKVFTRRPPARPWANELTAALLKRQREDGSWANRLELVRENDPILATADAVTALAHCRTAAAK